MLGVRETDVRRDGGRGYETSQIEDLVGVVVRISKGMGVPTNKVLGPEI